MTKPLLSAIYKFISLLIFSFLSACSTIPTMDDASINQSVNYQERSTLMNNIQAWQITGKIAFIQENKRESATLFWQVDESKNQQTLNLTTVLGINVLQLKTENGIHTLIVDGNTYYTEDLDQLIFQLTQLQIPTVALLKWLKGLQYSSTDQLTFGNNDFLPTKLTSQYNGETWQISYQKYKQLNQYQLASSFIIKQGDFTMKLLVNNWKILEENE